MDAHEALEKIEDEIYRTEEAIEQLTPVRYMDDIVEQLRDRVAVLYHMKGDAMDWLEREHNQDQIALMNEYWRSVL